MEEQKQSRKSKHCCAAKKSTCVVITDLLPCRKDEGIWIYAVSQAGLSRETHENLATEK